MNTIDFFKLQSKNLFRDYKTQRPATDDDPSYFGYNPTYFDIDGLFLDFDVDEEKFTLMNAQHLIAQLAGFNKWTDMVKASSTELELAKLLFDNMDKVNADEWKFYIFFAQEESGMEYDSELKLEIFKQVYLHIDHQVVVHDYRLTSSHAKA